MGLVSSGTRPGQGVLGGATIHTLPSPGSGNSTFELPNLNRERSAYGRRYGIFALIVKRSSSLRSQACTNEF